MRVANRSALQLICVLVLQIKAALSSPLIKQEGSDSIKAVVDRILKNAPIFDGHNDLSMSFRNLVQNDISNVDISTDLTLHPFWYKAYNETQTDLIRMKASGYGGQFWSVYTECNSQLKDSVEQTLEQIDLVKRLVKKYPDHLHWATSSHDISEAFDKGKIASLIGIEGGHSIQSNYGILRMYYELGARYLTLTHACNTPWADSSLVDQTIPTAKDFLLPEHNGLSNWGLGVIDELNRLGMMADLSHTSAAVMRQTLTRTKAPVIFSHSASRAVFDHHRNVPDDVLKLVKSTDSIIMLNVFASYLRKDGNEATIADVIAHANHIRTVAGVDHIGIGADYDGVALLPKGLEHPGKLRNLIEALYAEGTWTEEDLEKLTSRNIRRIFAKVEQVRDQLKSEEPKQNLLAVGQYWKHESITQTFF